MERDNMVDMPARQAWSTPVLDQLTVDLDAIANGGKNGNDGKGAFSKS